MEVMKDHDEALFTRCEHCRQMVTICHRGGVLMLAAHVMPKPTNDRWREGDPCPNGRLEFGRVVEL